MMQVSIANETIVDKEELHAARAGSRFGLADEALYIDHICMLLYRHEVLFIGVAQQAHDTGLQRAGFEVELLGAIAPHPETDGRMCQGHARKLIYNVP